MLRHIARPTRTQAGFSLIGVMIASAIGLIVLGSLTVMILNFQKATNAGKYRVEADTFNEEVRSLLSSQGACVNTFGGLVADVAASHAITNLKDASAAPGVTRYSTGQFYGDRSLLLNGLVLAQFIPGATADTGEMTLSSQIGSARDSIGPQEVSRSIRISVKRDAANLITACIALSKMSDGLWQRSTLNLANIFYLNPSGGNVGVGTSSPDSRLSVTDTDRSTATGSLASTLHVRQTIAPTSVSDAWFLPIFVETGGGGLNVNITRGIEAVYGLVNWDETTATVFSTYGVEGRVRSTASGIINNSIGVAGTIEMNANGTINSGIGLQGYVLQRGTGTIASAIGANLAVYQSAAGTINTGYGLYVGPIQTTTKWSIYAMDATAPVYLAANTGIGTTTPAFKLEVNGTIAPTGNGTTDLGAAGNRFKDIYATNGAINTSDARQKKDVEASDLGLDFILDLRPVSYRWRQGDALRHYGVIAQETESVLNTVKAQSNRTDDVETAIVAHDHKTDAYGVRYTELIAPLIKAVQEIYEELVGTRNDVAIVQNEVIKLKTENEALKKENEDIRVRLSNLEKAFAKR